MKINFYKLAIPAKYLKDDYPLSVIAKIYHVSGNKLKRYLTDELGYKLIKDGNINRVPLEAIYDKNGEPLSEEEKFIICLDDLRYLYPLYRLMWRPFSRDITLTATTLSYIPYEELVRARGLSEESAKRVKEICNFILD